MNLKFFKNIKTIEELRTQYRILVFAHHPDRGGNERMMLEINVEYDWIKDNINLESVSYQSKTQAQKDEWENFDEQLRAKIESLVDSRITADIEVCGNWIWLSNTLREEKEVYKTKGFFWASAKKMWYWHPVGYKRVSRKTWDMDRIRGVHGSYKVENDKKSNLLGC